MSFKVLVADDKINDKLDPIYPLPGMLRAAGYDVVLTPDGNAVYDLVFEARPDLVLLDIQFGKEKELGFDICEAIRCNDAKIPIIMITVPMSGIEYILRGFDAGADDYVVRPRDNREIIARIRANLPSEVLMLDNYLCVDLVGSQVYLRPGGRWQKVYLPRLLFDLLKKLIENAGLIISDISLKITLWPDKTVGDSVLGVCILRLRQKIEPDPENPIYIETIKGLGYRLNGKVVHVSRQAFLNQLDA